MAQVRTLLLAAAMLALLAAGSARATLQAAWLRNVSYAAFVNADSQLAQPCAEAASRAAAPPLLRAAGLQPGTASNWRALLRLQGRVDRAWVAQQAEAAPPEVFQPPPAWSLNEDWNAYRCGAAWDAWTVALMEGALGNWEAAVAYYQAGLGLAPGRVPPVILQEYYLALGRYQLGRAPAAAVQLQAAKYLALAGQADEARPLFASAAQSPGLGAAQRCEAALGLAWLDAGGSAVPPWPAALPAGGTCDAALAQAALPVLPGAEAAPEWQFAASDSVSPKLVGLDLDRDVLDAGAELVGYLYWQAADGSVERQRIRQPNLWPNSGNTWLPLEGFWACLPGYTEPDWVSPCGSSLTLAPPGAPETGPAGLLTVPGGGPDTYVSTASVPVPAGRAMLYGGRWRVNGDFPRGQVARLYISGEPALYYEVLLDLAGLPQGQWQTQAALIPALPADYDFSNWIRPQVDVGQGELGFDDVFAFGLPPYGE